VEKWKLLPLQGLKLDMFKYMLFFLNDKFFRRCRMTIEPGI
jgi:hypothetical protein